MERVLSRVLSMVVVVVYLHEFGHGDIENVVL